jgi:hypothetical protein
MTDSWADAVKEIKELLGGYGERNNWRIGEVTDDIIEKAKYGAGGK